ncbi:hypothetical protein ACMHYB_22850 [Sorangium sp. So ce1128]
MISIIGPACTGGTFHVESALAATPMVPVTGTLGLNNRNCEPGLELPDHDAPVAVGSLTGVVGAPHRALTTKKLFGEAALRDYQRFIGSLLPHVASGRRVGDALAKIAGSDPATSPAAQVDDLLRGIEFVLALPGSMTETTTFTFLANRDEDAITGACSTTDTARTFGFFDGPRFSMTCRLASEADGVPHVLKVRAYGSWANAQFTGELSAAGGERATFKSQNVSVAGAGAIRGFDLRTATGQVAAVSFWQVPESTGGTKEPRYLPRAWMLPSQRKGWSDVVAATLALAYVYPWPTACDAQRLRTKGLATVPADMMR